MKKLLLILFLLCLLKGAFSQEYIKGDRFVYYPEHNNRDLILQEIANEVSSQGYNYFALFEVKNIPFSKKIKYRVGVIEKFKTKEVKVIMYKRKPDFWCYEVIENEFEMI